MLEFPSIIIERFYPFTALAAGYAEGSPKVVRCE